MVPGLASELQYSGKMSWHHPVGVIILPAGTSYDRPAVT